MGKYEKAEALYIEAKNIRETYLNKVKVMPDVYLIGEIVPAHEGVMMTSKSGKLHKIVAQGWQHFTG